MVGREGRKEPLDVVAFLFSNHSRARKEPEHGP